MLHTAARDALKTMALVETCIRSSREGGRPMYEPEALARANVPHGIVFFATDHGFDLAFDPRAKADAGFVAARLREDGHDWLLYERLGKPATYKYSFDPARPGEEPKITPYSPLFGGTGAEGRYRFEAEADWPPLAQSGGWAIPRWTLPCAGGRRALALFGQGYEAKVTIELPVPASGRWKVRPRVVAVEDGGHARLVIALLALQVVAPQQEPLDRDALLLDRLIDRLAVSARGRVVERTAERTGLALAQIVAPRREVADRLEPVGGARLLDRK